MLVPSRVLQMMSKSDSLGAAGVKDGDPPVNQTGELFLQTLHGLAETLQLLNLNLRLFLVDVNHLQLATVGALPPLNLFEKLHLILLDNVPGDISQFSVLSDLVRRPGTDGLTIDVDVRFLSQIEPDDRPVLGVDVTTDFLQSSLKPGQSGLTTAVNLEARNSPEVWTAGDGIRQFLDFVKMIQHADRSLHVPHVGGLSCPGG